MSLPERWWTDVSKAQQVLSVVGGDDVAQSVGTVALGYHAVVADKLRPLAHATLIDYADVGSALEEVDLLPVAKAMSVAVSPVLGDASSAYAADLVTQLHEEARDGIRHELTVLTSKGVSWPQAIERICGVAGVPARAVNGYVQKMAAPQVNPRVLADEGDRTLMTWASRLGAREATSPLNGVAKAQQPFDPREHPRGEAGRFVSDQESEEGDAGGAQRKDRLQRLQRLQRLTGLQRRQQAEQAQAAAAAAEKKRAEKKSLAELQSEVLNRGLRNPGLRNQGLRNRGQRAAGLRNQGQRVERQEQTRAVTRAADAPANVRRARQESGLQMHERAYIDVDPMAVAFFHAHEGDTISAVDIARAGDGSMTTTPNEQEAGKLRLILDDARAEHENPDGTYDLDLNHDYEVELIDAQSGEMGIDVTMVLRRRGAGSGSGPIGKADFEEAEHPRDEAGRFAEGRRDRLNRLQRLQGMANRQAQARAATQQAEESEAKASAAEAVLARRGARNQGIRNQGIRNKGLRATGRRLEAQDQVEVEGEGKDQPSLAQIARSEQLKARDAQLLSHYKSALLVDDFAITQLTGHYAGSAELEGEGVPLLSQKDKTPSELKAVLRHSLMSNTNEVGRQLAVQAMSNIRQAGSMHDRIVELGDPEDSHLNFGTPEEARSEAKLMMMGEEVDMGDEVLVPGVRKSPRTGLWQPVAFKQPYKNTSDTPDAPKHVITGTDEAIFRLRQGDTAGLVIRQVDYGLDGRALERMGGGDASLPYAEPWIESAVMEVVDTRQQGNRRA